MVAHRRPPWVNDKPTCPACHRRITPAIAAPSTVRMAERDPAARTLYCRRCKNAYNRSKEETP